MGLEVIAVYDTNEKVESRTEAKLLARLLFEYVPLSIAWVSAPAEDDPAGKNWVPQWSDIPQALAEVERFLSSEVASQMAVDGFTTEELIDELCLFRDELRAARRHTSRFHLCAY